MTLFSLTIIWAGLAAFVVLLAVARKWVTRREDDTLHLHEFDTTVVQRQSSVAGLLNRVDWIGKSLTVVVLVYGIALIGRIVYLAWVDSLRLH
jgi:hypothetical protein